MVDLNFSWRNTKPPGTMADWEGSPDGEYSTTCVLWLRSGGVSRSTPSNNGSASLHLFLRSYWSIDSSRFDSELSYRRFRGAFLSVISLYAITTLALPVSFLLPLPGPGMTTLSVFGDTEL